jgi:hypothetical protein
MHSKSEVTIIQTCYIILIIFTSVAINFGAQVYAESINATNLTSIGTNEPVNSAKPTLVVDQNCQIASPIVPGTFIASGFPPKTHLGVVINRENTTQLNTRESTSPFTGLHNDITDSLGNIEGEFNIDTSRGPDEGYQLQIFVDNNRDDHPDPNFETATSPVGC